MMNIENELEAVSNACTRKQQQDGLSLLIRILQDVIECINHEKAPRPVKIEAIVKRTHCQNFINILLCTGYYKMSNNKQLKFDASQLPQLLRVFDEIKQYAQSVTINKLSRHTMKLEPAQQAQSQKQQKTTTAVSSKHHRKQTSQSTPCKLGAYRIEQRMANGAFGRVYRCSSTHHALTHSSFAMKLFEKKRTNRQHYETEIEILSSLPTHPNVVSLVEVVEDDDFVAIVLPYFESGSLLQFIRDFGVENMTELHVKAFIDQILKGLQFLHQQGVIHGDIKASNVLIGDDGVAKLADFGISRHVFHEKTESKRTEGGDEQKDQHMRKQTDFIGSPYWMAPELIEMEPMTPACDIWAVGVVCIELFTGYPPYAELDPFGALFRIVQDSHPPLPEEIGELFCNFLMRCFAKNPLHRSSAKRLLRHKWLTELEEHIWWD